MRSRKFRVRRGPASEKEKPFFDKPNKEHTAFFQGGGQGAEAVQRKLAVGRSNSPQEKEAESAAKQVTQVQKAEKKEDDKPVQKADKKEEDKPVQKADKKEEEKPVQKADKKEEDKPVQKSDKKEDEKPGPVQKSEKKEEASTQQKIQREIGHENEEAGAARGGVGSPALESLLARRKGMGSSLPDEIRVEMERKFQSSFREVRIHSDKEAEDICESIHALAFAYGHDIYFNKGQYNPNSNTGRELLAHELAHVVQQNG